MHRFRWSDIKIQLGILIGLIVLLVGGFWYISNAQTSADVVSLESFPLASMQPSFSPSVFVPSPSPSFGVSPTPIPSPTGQIADLPIELTMDDEETAEGGTVGAEGITVEARDYNLTKSFGSCTTTVTAAKPNIGTCKIADVPGPQYVWLYFYGDNMAKADISSKLALFEVPSALAQNNQRIRRGGRLLHDLEPLLPPQVGVAKALWNTGRGIIQGIGKGGKLNVDVSGLGANVKAKVTVKAANGRGDGATKPQTGNGLVKFDVKAKKRYIVTVTAPGYQPHTSAPILVPEKPPVKYPVRMIK